MLSTSAPFFDFSCIFWAKVADKMVENAEKRPPLRNALLRVRLFLIFGQIFRQVGGKFDQDVQNRSLATRPVLRRSGSFWLLAVLSVLGRVWPVWPVNSA